MGGSLGRPSPHQQADRPRAHPPPKHHKSESFPATPCGTARTPRISHPFKRLSRSEGQVTHVLLTRSPLTHPSKNRDRPVRLACVKHAASVRPEPGSNSPKKTKNKTNQPQATTTHTPTTKPGHAHQQPTTRKTKTNQKTRTAHPQRHKTPHNHHHKQRSSNHTRPHNATDRPWHKKQAHYRDLKQHTHKKPRRE